MQQEYVDMVSDALVQMGNPEKVTREQVLDIIMPLTTVKTVKNRPWGADARIWRGAISKSLQQLGYVRVSRANCYNPIFMKQSQTTQAKGQKPIKEEG